MGALILDPNFAFLLLVAGALALSFEAHAPGLFFPALIGVALFATGALGLYENSPTWYGALLLFVALLLFAAELRFFGHGFSAAAGAALLFAGALALLRGAHRIDPWLAAAVACAGALLAVSLGWLAARAHKGKPLTGVEHLIGAVGVAQTAISGHGVVFLDGAYWQAHSSQPIEAGRKVVIQRVQNLALEVHEA
jgi:membrane-bound serine protease (ClpP class)